MSANPTRPTLADYVVIALSPVLIMTLVGTLVFFLVEVLYVGRYTPQLLWGLFFFVIAAVLIARMTIQRNTVVPPGLYALALAVPVWLTLQFYVEYPSDSPLVAWKWLINLGLMGLAWWCAHRLTWDCTHIDDNVEAGGEGLLQASGLAAGGADLESPEAEEIDAGQELTWWQRYQRYREKRDKQHTPGVWVVYFSLAALPLFGLGQSLIPVEQDARRRYVFWLMMLYLGSGLGLLLTTCFLGLRRYLRQRQLRMPVGVTSVWLTMGGLLIAALLVIGAVIPRPRTETPIVEMTFFNSKERDASKWAMKDGAPGKGEGRASTQSPPPDQQARAEGQQNGKAGGQKGQGAQEQGQRGSGSGQKPKGGQGGSQQGDKSSGQGRNQDGSDKGGQKDQGDRTGSGQKGEPGQDRQSNAAQQQTNRGTARDGERGGGRQSANQPQQSDSQDNKTSERSQTSASSSALQRLSSFVASLTPILRWVVFGIIVLVVVFLIARSVLKFLANFTDWAKSLLAALQALWNGLFGWLQPGARPAPAGGSEGVEQHGTPPRPFADFANPFRDGTANRRSPEELVRYSFAALQAWARERDLGRQPEETPLEFVTRLDEEVPALAADARRLAGLYVRAEYGRGPLPGSAREVVKQFWKQLEATAEQPLSA